MSKGALLIWLLLLVVGCQTPSQQPLLSHVRTEGTGLDLTDLDHSVKPETDFYQFATGGWQKKNPVPPNRSHLGPFRNSLGLQRKILEHLASSSQTAGSIEQKLGDFYASGLDLQGRDDQGLGPIISELSRISAIQNAKELREEVARLHLLRIFPYFSVSSSRDPRDAQRFICELGKGALGLPNRAAYGDKGSKQLILAYHNYAVQLFILAGDSPPVAKVEADNLLSVETRLARAYLAGADIRHHPIAKVSELQPLTPSWSWEVYFGLLGLPALDSVIGLPVTLLPGLDAELGGRQLAQQKSYLRFTLLNVLAEDLTDKIVAARFEFYGKRLAGVHELPPPWQRVVTATNENLGFALGQKYVAQMWTPGAQAKVEELTQNLRAAMLDKIEANPGLSASSKKKARQRLAEMRQYIGSPTRWRNYDALRIEPKNYLRNVLAGRRFKMKGRLERIGKSVDPLEWEATPQTANAAYEPVSNSLILPVAILQPPFFSERYDVAVNYGGIGALIGHELSHWLDAESETRDEEKACLTEEERKSLQAEADTLAEQFADFRTSAGTPLNGDPIKAEARADLGGLELAYDALMALDSEATSKSLEGMTAPQRFFLSFARVRAMSMKPEYEESMVRTDSHPLPRFRVNVTVSNMASFQSAFRIPQGTPMWRDSRVVVW